MSTFLIQCPDCGIELEVDEQYIGRKAVCLICQYRFIIQEQNTEQANSSIEKSSKTNFKESCAEKTDLKPQKNNSIFSVLYQNGLKKIQAIYLYCKKYYKNLRVFCGIVLISVGCFCLIGVVPVRMHELFGDGIFITGVVCVFYGCVFFKKQQASGITKAINIIVKKVVERLRVVDKKSKNHGSTDSNTQPVLSSENRLAALLKKCEAEDAEEIELFSEDNAKEDEKAKTAPHFELSTVAKEADIDDEEELSNDSPRKRLAAFLENVKIENIEEDVIPEKLPAEPSKEYIEDILPEYTLPPISMLSKGDKTSGEFPEIIKQNTLIIQRTLASFRISGEVVGYVCGPRTTRYEISLADGSAVNKFMRLESTFAAKLAVSNICLLSSIRGTNNVGIEIPNTRPLMVLMRNVMETDLWRHNNAAIPIVIGENSSAEPIVIDLAKAPHLLIGGSTGSGKSVCLDTLIMSLLFKFSPDELHLIMFDPNHIDFANYNRLPHLLTPVICKAAKLVSALRWTVTEMEYRYKILARAGVKKLADFNALSKNGKPVPDSEGKPIFDRSGNPIRLMPTLIIIISEFAELHNQNSWLDAETFIDQITKSGRATGIHIVMATQRPSADIVSGKIKANFPVRIAFRVPQNIDSRIILDQPGAEKLFGQGDMLAKLPGAFGLERIQGALVDDKDIKAIVKFISDQRPQVFDDTVIAEGEEFGNDESNPPLRKGGAGTSEEDDLFDDMDYAQIAPLVKKYLQPGDDDTMRRALEVVILGRKASTWYIQLRLKIGYNRAAELIDAMEERGIVGPPSGSGNKREILIFDELEVSY